MSRWFKCDHCKSEWPVANNEVLSEWEACDLCGARSWVETNALTPMEKSDIRALLESYGHCDLADRIDDDGE